jgi:hypothetical protein
MSLDSGNNSSALYLPGVSGRPNRGDITNVDLFGRLLSHSLGLNLHILRFGRHSGSVLRTSAENTLPIALIAHVEFRRWGLILLLPVHTILTGLPLYRRIWLRRVRLCWFRHGCGVWLR